MHNRHLNEFHVPGFRVTSILFKVDWLR